MSEDERIEFRRANIRQLRRRKGKTLFDQIEEAFRDAAPGAYGDHIDGVIFCSSDRPVTAWPSLQEQGQ